MNDRAAPRTSVLSARCEPMAITACSRVFCRKAFLILMSREGFQTLWRRMAPTSRDDANAGHDPEQHKKIQAHGEDQRLNLVLGKGKEGRQQEIAAVRTSAHKAVPLAEPISTTRTWRRRSASVGSVILVAITDYLSAASFQRAALTHYAFKENLLCIAVLSGRSCPGRQRPSAPRRRRKWPRRPS